jgi:hypothetical protein
VSHGGNVAEPCDGGSCATLIADTGSGRADPGCQWGRGGCRRKDRLRTSRFSATDDDLAAWFKPIPLKLCRGVSRTGLASSRPPAPSRRGRRFWRRWYQLTASLVRPLRRRVVRWLPAPPSSAMVLGGAGTARRSICSTVPWLPDLDVVPGFRWLTSSWARLTSANIWLTSRYRSGQPIGMPIGPCAVGRRCGLWDRRVGGRTRPKGRSPAADTTFMRTGWTHSDPAHPPVTLQSLASGGPRLPHVTLYTHEGEELLSLRLP